MSYKKPITNFPNTQTPLIIYKLYSAFTIKLAPKRFKSLLEWGAVLSQAINELPSQVELPYQSQQSTHLHDGLYHARPSVAFGVNLRADYGNNNHGMMFNSRPETTPSVLVVLSFYTLSLLSVVHCPFSCHYSHVTLTPSSFYIGV